MLIWFRIQLIRRIDHYFKLTTNFVDLIPKETFVFKVKVPLETRR